MLVIPDYAINLMKVINTTLDIIFKMTKLLAFSIVFTLVLTTTQAQVVIVNENCTAAYTDILSLKFEDAQNKIDVEKLKNPQNIYSTYLENYIDFLKVTISEDEKLFNSIEDIIPERIEKIKTLNDTSRYKKYFIGNINLQWGTVRARFGEYFTSAIEINRAYRLLEANNKSFPNFIPNSITLGILHIMIGIIPDSYRWVLNLISMYGSVGQGQNELKQAYLKCETDTTYNFLKDEILFYMGMIGLSMTPDPEFAEYLISELKYANSKNLLLNYLTINTMMRTGRNDYALSLFTKIDYSENYYPFYYLDYLHGECYLRSLDTDMAKEEYNIFLTNFNGQNFIKAAWQKTAWAALIEHDTLGYHKAIQNVMLRGATNIDADKSAERAAKNGIIPNVDLIKCRLLIDGGYYNKAQNILVNLDENKLSLVNRVEKNYRLGRVFQDTKNFQNAKNYFNTTIELGSSLPEYYAANAALKLGNIYEVEDDTVHAMYYYNLCLDMDFDEYKNSIRGKAKQGLKRVSIDE